jgi:hypothetical protein
MALTLQINTKVLTAGVRPSRAPFGRTRTKFGHDRALGGTYTVHVRRGARRWTSRTLQRSSRLAQRDEAPARGTRSAGRTGAGEPRP